MQPGASTPALTDWFPNGGERNKSVPLLVSWVLDRSMFACRYILKASLPSSPFPSRDAGVRIQVIGDSCALILLVALSSLEGWLTVFLLGSLVWEVRVGEDEFLICLSHHWFVGRRLRDSGALIPSRFLFAGGCSRWV